MNKIAKSTYRRIASLLIVSVFCLYSGCRSLNPHQEGTEPVNHQLWTELLSKHVNEDGWVDYQGFKEDTAKLNEYLKMLSDNPPNEENWSKEEQLAYWINVYNAFTIQLVLQHYPLESIKEIGSSIQVPFVNTPWDIKFIELAGNTYDLNNIEHNIIRKNFDEPRIHFAINCASVSCPRLRDEAYTAEKLEEQLQQAGEVFLNDPSRNKITSDQLVLSKVFSWFKGDFTKNGELVDFVRKFTDKNIQDDADIDYMEYDWSLNDQ